MKTFESTSEKKITFSSCEECDALCCDGARGTTFSQLILEDFNEVFENFPILFLRGSQGYLKPVVLLSNGQGFCPYIQNFRCTIYEKRPSVCKIYPLSPHITDDIFVDTRCPAVSIKKSKEKTPTFININANHPHLNTYQDKYITMHLHFQKFNEKENLAQVCKIDNHVFYKFKNSFDDKYIKQHLDSLKLLEKGYFKDKLLFLDK